jgi:hypothetical protein
MTHGSVRFLAALVLVAGCGESSTPLDAASPRDAFTQDAPRLDAPSPVDAPLPVDDVPGLDAAALADASEASDSGPVSDTGSSSDAAPSPDDAAMLADAASPVDAASDAGPPPNDCVAGGGRCVPVVPGSCRGGITGDPTWYSCGGGLGVSCCLPANTPPECRNVGTRSEGWYQPDGMRICFAMCNGASASCEAIGTRSEGWYADVATASCGSTPVERLIEWINCAP